MPHEKGVNNAPPTPSSNGFVELQQTQPPPPPPPNGAAQTPTVTQKWFEEMRGGIMVVAVLVASVTYTSGLNPPGGFWQDDSNGHEAGGAILHDKSPRRYATFFYANATAFMASLVIIILLMNEKFYFSKSKIVMLNISMVLGLVSLMIAYAAGCARRISTSIYVIVLAVVVLLFVIYSAHFLPHICSFTERRAPWVRDVVGPTTASAQDSVHNRKERSKMPKSSSV